MTVFLRLLSEQDKSRALSESCARVRGGETDTRVFELAEDAFDVVPGKPFAYWVSDDVRGAFERLKRFEADDRTARQGLATAEDFRFVRAWWEHLHDGRWVSFAKGGAFARFYADVYLSVNWQADGKEIKAGICRRYPYLNGNAEFVAKNTQFYRRPGITWPLRTNGLSFRVMPAGCIFGHKGPAAFVLNDEPEDLLALVSLLNSRAFGLLVSVQLARVELAQSFEVGLIQQTPVPSIPAEKRMRLAVLARRAWSLQRIHDTTGETSHAFLLPAMLRSRLGDYDPRAIEGELTRIHAEIDASAFDLYAFSNSDRAFALGSSPEIPATMEAPNFGDDADDEDEDQPNDKTDGNDALLSWAVGVAFGRFDWRLATGERAAPPEPEPFDPLPAKSPGMLPDGAEPFHAHAGIFVNDPGHPQELARVVERVLERVDMPVPTDLSRWLQREFFPFHLRRYSKSRRKAPIYWPLSTASGSYTLWLYYPALSSQTLYTAINDFVDPKLADVAGEADQLRGKGSARSRDDERYLEQLATLEAELRDLRDQLQAVAAHYQPNHDDGVQIIAAPLWPLFRHKPWHKLLKDTWAKLEKGDYDWSHLAMNYWPDRVREKCKTDKSLAIAHGLERLYVEPEAKPKKEKSRKDAAA